jgi:phenylacetate-CoA ligase
MHDRAVVRRVAAFLPDTLREGYTYWRWRRFLEQAQWWSAAAIEAWQLRRFRNILNYAYEYTEGYRELYRAAGIHPRDIQTLQDRRFLPFVTKQMLQSDVEAFSIRRRRRIYITTGGSTGIPFGFYVMPRDHASERAFIHAGWRMGGWDPTTRSAILRGGFVGSADRYWNFDPYRQQLFLSTYFLTPGSVADYLRIARDYSTVVLQAYPSALNILCDLIEEQRLHSASPFSLLLLGSENVYGWLLEKALAILGPVKIHAWYGHAEQAVLAPWCEQSRTYHVWPFYGLVDILDGENRDVPIGAEGEIVATSLRMSTTPFIRYRTMDRGERGMAKCEHCGRHFQIIPRIAGRAHEVIVTETGRYISMTMINFHDEIFDCLRQFQFRQTQRGSVTFAYVPKMPLGETERAALATGIMQKLGHDMTLRLQEVDTIERTSAGKYKFLDQRLDIRYGDRDA